MASITYNGMTVPLIIDDDEWTAQEVFGAERMLGAGLDDGHLVGRASAIAGVSIARVVPGFSFPDSIIAMKGKELKGILTPTLEAIGEEMVAEAQRKAALEQANAVEGEVLSPTSAGSDATPPPA